MHTPLPYFIQILGLAFLRIMFLPLPIRKQTPTSLSTLVPFRVPQPSLVHPVSLTMIFHIVITIPLGIRATLPHTQLSLRM